MDIVLLLAIGAKVGQKVVKDEPIETPTVNPFKAYREMKQQKEDEEAQNRIDTILRNIESYDGTGYGQEDVR